MLKIFWRHIFLWNENISKFYHQFFFFSSSTANDFAISFGPFSICILNEKCNPLRKIERELFYKDRDRERKETFSTSLRIPTLCYDIWSWNTQQLIQSNLTPYMLFFTIMCDAKRGYFWIQSSPKCDDSCPQKVFDFGVISLCMFWKKCDFGQSLTVQRTSKKSKNHQYRFHTVEKRFWFRSRSA